MTEFLKSSALLLMLLNPFLVIVYLIDIMQTLEKKAFSQVLIRAGIIASIVFCVFAILGDSVFSEFAQVDFASFQIFGGIVFLLIGLQFVFRGPRAIEILRGESEHLAGAIAMPVFIGPGTISASVIIGQQLDLFRACFGVFFAVTFSIAIILLLKTLYDIVRPRHERLIQRYIEIAGRITALYVGTVSIQMIMLGMIKWGEKF
jgi:small neutral amino acid transporter SnatA (MarC family)